ncbi:MAG TPA: phosphoglucosamine mutase, partial [Bacteroidia bacterium]|nr:phosphoglucosamine mutase [Bacteroidia bacterium]
MPSSTRRHFGTDGIRCQANRFPLVPEFVVRLGQAAATVLLSRQRDSRLWPTVVIGKDTRQSCDMLESAVAAGLTSCGVDVRLAGVVPTPAVAQLVREEGTAFGIVISASHNPFEDNGIKFFGPDGYKLDDAIELEIEALLDSPTPAPHEGPVGRIAALPRAAERYIEFIRASVGEDRDLFAGLHVALDTANGASCETSPEILRSLGAKVSAFHHHPNGININADCGCTHPQVIGDLVRQTGADIGVAHDGDADRVLLCDEMGSTLD